MLLSLPSKKHESFPYFFIKKFFRTKYVGILLTDPLASSLENEGDYDPDLFEGDMILTTEQRMATRLGLDVDNPFGRASTKGKQWPGGVVPYIIDSEIGKNIIVLI